MLINGLHLLWIIPLVILMTSFSLLFMIGAREKSRDYEIYMEGKADGVKELLEKQAVGDCLQADGW